MSLTGRDTISGREVAYIARLVGLFEGSDIPLTKVIRVRGYTHTTMLRVSRDGNRRVFPCDSFPVGGTHAGRGPTIPIESLSAFSHIGGPMEVDRCGDVLHFTGNGIMTQVMLRDGEYSPELGISYSKYPKVNGKYDRSKEVTAHCTEVSGTSLREAIRAVGTATYDNGTIAVWSSLSGTFIVSSDLKHRVRISRDGSDDSIISYYDLDYMKKLASVMNSDCTAQIWLRKDYPLKVEWRNKRFPLTFSLMIAPRIMNG